MFIYINGFWPAFAERTDGVHWGFFEYILERVFDSSIHITGSIDHADILLESYFGSSVFSQKVWKYSIFFSGEAFENAELDDYITEKILNPFRAGTIPVYFGSQQIAAYFNPTYFVRVTTLEETVLEINRLLSDPAYRKNLM